MKRNKNKDLTYCLLEVVLCCNGTFIYSHLVCMVCVNFLKSALKYSFISPFTCKNTCCPYNIITWIQLCDQHLSITQQYNKGHILYMFSKSNLSFCPFKSWPMNFLLALYRSQKPFIIHVERFYVTKIRFFWINWIYD